MPLKEWPLTDFARGDVRVHILVVPQFLAFKLVKKSAKATLPANRAAS